MKRLKNSKGMMIIETIMITFMVTSALITLSVPSIKDNFRAKKAIEMCQETGATDCKEMVSSWSKEDILDYIADDAPADVVMNGGVFVNGKMNN